MFNHQRPFNCDVEYTTYFLMKYNFKPLKKVIFIAFFLFYLFFVVTRIIFSQYRIHVFSIISERQERSIWIQKDRSWSFVWQKISRVPWFINADSTPFLFPWVGISWIFSSKIDGGNCISSTFWLYVLIVCSRLYE